MKRIIKFWFVSFVSLLIAAQIITSINFSHSYLVVAQAAVFLTVFEYFLKPIVKLLFLPINIITLGTLRWLINVFSLYMATALVVGFSITPFHFPGLNRHGLIILPIQLSLFWTYVAASFLENITAVAVNWIV